MHIFSRNQENNTSKYPDIISRIDKCKSESVKSCVLDCEAVGWDRNNKVILPFQILSTRKRKVNMTDFFLFYVADSEYLGFVAAAGLLFQRFHRAVGEAIYWFSRFLRDLVTRSVLFSH